MWSSHPTEESTLSLLKATEAFPSRHGGDLLAVTLQNAGNNNIDVFLHQAIVDHVVFDSTTGRVGAQVSITLKNGAPASGLPAALIDNPGAPAFPPGSNYAWMSIYTPLQLSHASVDGVALAMSRDTELGVNVYSGFVDIPPMSTDVARVSLSGMVDPSPRYRLHLRVQPSANPVSATVSVTSSQSPGRTSTWKPSSAVTQVHTFNP